MGRFAYRAGLRFNGIELVRLEPRTWACRCHCGSEFKLKSMTALRIGTLKSCGCNSSERFSYAPGQRFNDIELLRQVVGGWVCRCHCGNEFTVENMTNLRLGKRKSCGCTRVPYRRTSFFSYAAGQRYGGIELVRMDPRKWVCRCHCGKEFTPTSMSRLRVGKLKSCGCLKETLKSKDPLFPQFFSHLHNRKHGRFCEEWATFEGFKSDMKDFFFEGAKLDRHDLTKDFSKTNCFWSTVEAYDKRRWRRSSRPLVKCACGVEFRQQTSGKIHCSKFCKKRFGGVVNSVSQLSPDQIQEMKTAILEGSRGYGLRLANKFGLTLGQVWAFARQVRSNALIDGACPVGTPSAGLTNHTGEPFA